MREPKPEATVKSVEALLTEKEAVTAKERELVRGLNQVLKKIGYEVVALDTGAPARGGRRRGRRVGRRRGGPPKAQAKRRGSQR